KDATSEDIRFSKSKEAVVVAAYVELMDYRIVVKNGEEELLEVKCPMSEFSMSLEACSPIEKP
ncbi:hypothetical protein HPB47_023078, partial [Ixodes persulcatus]